MPRGPAATSARGAILEAALELFATQGYEATTIEDVRDASGASTGSIYHHFGSKEGLAATLFVEGIAAFQSEALEVYETHADAEEGVRALVRRYLEWIAQSPTLGLFLLTTREPELRAATTPAMRELNQRFDAATNTWREGHMTAGRVRSMPVELYRVTVLGPAEAFAKRWLRGRTDISLETAIKELADSAWRAVGP